MKGLFKDASVIAHWNEGDWQGQVCTCVKLPDERVAIYSDWYGSCSGCDGWEYADDEEVRKLCIDLANGAYVFNSLEDVMEFLSGDNFDRYSWDGPSKHLLAAIKEGRVD